MTTARTSIALSIAVLLLAAPVVGQTRQASVAQYVVIVHRANPTRSVERAFLADAFLKRITRWPDGETIRPIDLPADSPTRVRFSDAVLRRPVAAVRNYWQQIIFSGRGLPPLELENDRAVVHYVSANPGAVGYVSGATDTSTVGALTVR